jgi:ribosome biogenesis GTPase
MIFMDNGAILIDTPGMREFQPWSDQESVSNAFGDIQGLAATCRFADCQHLHETGCAVKHAVEAGIISSSHYNNYLRLKREMAYQETLLDMNKARERKNFFKRQIKTYNKIVRKKRKEE